MRDFGTYSQKRKAALRRRKIVCALCALVTLGAGWVLMRPAITLSDQPECGLEAHTHTEECYTQQIGPAPLVCTLEEHAHNDDCYDAEGNLLCQTQEHVHSEDCYGEPVSYPVLTCTIPEHIHTDDCCPIPEPTPAYTVAPELCCGMAEHTHGEGCYDGEDLICTIPEHIHTDICLAQQEPGQTEEPQQTEETEPLPPLDGLRQRLGIETEEDSAALDALLEQYGFSPEEILEGLKEMEADPEAERIDSLAALQALLEASAAVETLETEDGTLVPKTGGGYIGTVTVGDMTVTVDTASWQTGLDGCKLSVSTTETETVKMDHGEVVVDKGIAVKIVNADGTDCTASVQCNGITITATEAMTESASPKIYHHENGELKEYERWQKVSLSEDRKTLTTGKNFALPAEFLIDHWEPLTETYLDWPGASYSIGYILRKYNVFVQNDYTGSHVVGPVVAGGTVTLNGLGGLSYGNQYGAPHGAPSYIGTTNVNTIITAQPDLPVYLGVGMNPTGIGVNDGSGQDTGNYWYAQQYVDFTAAMRQIRAEMAGITGTAGVLGEDNIGKTLNAGGCYEFPAGAFGRGQNLNLLSAAAGQDTTIILRGETVNIPTVWLDGKQPDSIESGQQSGIVFLCPDAATVNGNAVTGHIVAPYAHVDLSGGYFNGCVIADSLTAIRTEGHMWAYSGQRMPMTTNNLQAVKLLNGKQITDQTLPNTTFTFDLYEKNAEDGWSEAPVQSVNNALSEVNFQEIIYQSPGEYLYKIQERNESATHPGIMFDSTVYYAKVTVTASGGSLLAKATYYSDEACQDQLPNAYSVTFNNRYGGKLPDTGGPGMRVYLLPGVFLMALALAGVCISRKRRAA